MKDCEYAVVAVSHNGGRPKMLHGDVKILPMPGVLKSLRRHVCVMTGPRRLTARVPWQRDHKGIEGEQDISKDARHVEPSMSFVCNQNCSVAAVCEASQTATTAQFWLLLQPPIA